MDKKPPSTHACYAPGPESSSQKRSFTFMTQISIDNFSDEALFNLRAFVDAELALRNHSFASTIASKPLTSLFTLPREVRNMIYDYCAISAGIGGKPTATSPCGNWQQLCTDVAVVDQVVNAVGSCFDNISVENKQAANTTSSRFQMPIALINTKNPTKFSDLRLVNKQLHQEIVNDAMWSQKLGVRLDFSEVANDSKVPHEFWDFLLPIWVARRTQFFNIEVRCSRQRWKLIQKSLIAKLRTLGSKVVIKIRIMIFYPLSEANDFEAKLPPECAFAKDAVMDKWSTKQLDGSLREFDDLKTLDSVERYEMLFIGRSRLQPLDRRKKLRADHLCKCDVAQRVGTNWEITESGVHYFLWCPLGRDKNGDITDLD